MRCCLYVACCVVWKFAKLESPRRLVQFWQNFQTSLVLLIPNCTNYRMITYTNTRHHTEVHVVYYVTPI